MVAIRARIKKAVTRAISKVKITAREVVSRVGTQITSRTTVVPTTTVTTKPVTPQIISVRVTDISGGGSVTTTRTTSPKGITTTTRKFTPPPPEVERRRLVTGAAVARPPITKEQAIALAKSSPLEEREIARTQQARTIAVQVTKQERPIRAPITGVGIQDFGPEAAGFGGVGTTGRFERFTTRAITERAKQLVEPLQVPITRDTGGIPGFDIRSPIKPKARARARARAKEKLGELRTGFGEGIGLTSDILGAAALRPISLFPTKPTVETGAELEARTQRVREQFRIKRPSELLGPLVLIRPEARERLRESFFAGEAPAVPLIPGPAGIISRGVGEAFRELREFRVGTKEAKRLQKKGSCTNKADY